MNRAVAMSNKQKLLPRRVSLRVYRFVLLTAAMIAGIAVLVSIEMLVLWRLGIHYVPRMSIRSVAVCEFAIDDTGRWGASRIAYVRSGREQSLQNEVLLHDMQYPDQPRRLSLPSTPRQVAIAARAERVVIACYDGRIYVADGVRNPRTPRLLARVPSGGADYLACSSDGQMVAAADARFLYLWRVAGGELLHRLALPHGPIVGFAFSQGANTLLVYTRDGEICLWDVARGEVSESFQVEGEIHQAFFLPDECGLAIVSPDGGTWQRSFDRCACDVTTRQLGTARGPQGAVAISRDAALVAVIRHRGGKRYCIELWDVKAGRQTGELPTGPGVIKGLQFAADGTLYGWDSNGLIQSWNPESQAERWRFCALQWARSEPSLKPAAAAMP